MDINFSNMPAYLKEHGRFCLWRYEERTDRKGNRKRTKVPYNPKKPGQRAASDNPDTFSTWLEILRIWEKEKGNFDGIGIGVFDDISAFDIDHCLNADGKPSDMAAEIINTLQCYAEISPSGSGIRVFFRAAPGLEYDRQRYYINNRSSGLEIYIAGMTKKFLTFTGNALRKDPVEVRGPEVLEIVRKYMKRPQKAEERQAGPSGSRRLILSDEEVLRKAEAASNGLKFMRLYSGDISGYSSQSEADQALCNILAFWTGGDAGQIDRLFRSSGLMREKWERKDYRSETIKKAIRDCRQFYSGPVRSTAAEDFPDPGGGKRESLIPFDFTDLGEAEVFINQYGDRIRYSPATGFLVYDGKRWRENDLDAQKLLHELTDRQLLEARMLRKAAEDHLMDVQESHAGMTRSALENDTELEAANDAVKAADNYHKFVLGRRKATAIKNTLFCVQSKVQVQIDDLDADGFLLNTPAGTVDLRTGQIRPHRAEDLLTKITAVSPDQLNADLFNDFLRRITGGDEDLIWYHKEVAGMALVGKVLMETLLIAIGSGGNGKSTFYNLQRRVMGDYSSGMSAEVLTVNNRKNKSPEYASLRGRRLVVAAELEEGLRLDSAVVKKLCSTDPVHAEEKFKAPFDFIPQHTVLLFTNHLPKVGTNDEGTWSRLAVIPFMTKFRGEKGEIKNYADHLFNECGGAVLSWMIEGAQAFIANGGFIEKPVCVEEAIAEYREDNNWLKAFIEDRCIQDPTSWIQAGVLYKVYKSWSEGSGEYTRNKADFKAALENEGYIWKKITRGAMYKGLSLRQYIDAEEEEVS